MNRVQMALMQANRQRMEKAMQSHRNQRAAQQNVQRPATVQRPGGVEISMRAIQQDAKRQTSAQAPEQKTASNSQNLEHRQGFAERVQNKGQTSGQVQNPVHSKENSLQSVKAREQQEKRTDRER